MTETFQIVDDSMVGDLDYTPRRRQLRLDHVQQQLQVRSVFLAAIHTAYRYSYLRDATMMRTE